MSKRVKVTAPKKTGKTKKAKHKESVDAVKRLVCRMMDRRFKMYETRIEALKEKFDKLAEQRLPSAPVAPVPEDQGWVPKVGDWVVWCVVRVGVTNPPKGPMLVTKIKGRGIWIDREGHSPDAEYSTEDFRPATSEEIAQAQREREWASKRTARIAELKKELAELESES